MSESKLYEGGDPTLQVLWRMGTKVQIRQKTDEPQDRYERLYAWQDWIIGEPPIPHKSFEYRIKPKE